MLGALYRIGICDKCYHLPVLLLLLHLSFLHGLNPFLIPFSQGNRKSAGFTNEERESFETNFLSKGFVDTFRKQHPSVVAYSYWGYRHNARKTNKGMYDMAIATWYCAFMTLCAVSHPWDYVPLSMVSEQSYIYHAHALCQNWYIHLLFQHNWRSRSPFHLLFWFVHWIEGWRLDYFLVSESIAEKVHDSYILPDISASDHSPLGLVLKL